MKLSKKKFFFNMTTFIYAVWKGNLEMIEYLYNIDNSMINDCFIEKVNQVETQRHSALYMSIKNADINSFYFLLNHGANPNSPENVQDNLLEISIGVHIIEIFKELLKRGCKENPDKKGSLLKTAILTHNEEILKILIENGEEVSISNFAEACKCNVNSAKLLIDHISSDELNKPFNGNFAVHWICQLGDFEVAEKALIKGIDVNKLNDNGKSGFHFLSHIKSVDVKLMNLFFDYGFDANITQEGNSVLGDFLITIYPNAQAIDCLLKHGASVDSILFKSNKTIENYVKGIRNKEIKKVFHDNLPNLFP